MEYPKNCYCLFMDKHKILKVTNKINLLQRESMVDKITFLTAQKYKEDIDLSTFDARVEYIDPNNVAHVEILTADEELYKENYIRYNLPVTSELSKYPGTIQLKLVFTKEDSATDTIYILRSTDTEIEVLEAKDYFAWVDDDSLTAIDNRILELQNLIAEVENIANVYDAIKADNIALNDDGSVQLKANGEFIGDALDLAVVEKPDDTDLDDDGIIDITGKYTTVNL